MPAKKGGSGAKQDGWGATEGIRKDNAALEAMLNHKYIKRRHSGSEHTCDNPHMH